MISQERTEECACIDVGPVRSTTNAVSTPPHLLISAYNNPHFLLYSFPPCTAMAMAPFLVLLLCFFCSQPVSASSGQTLHPVTFQRLQRSDATTQTVQFTHKTSGKWLRSLANTTLIADAESSSDATIFTIERLDGSQVRLISDDGQLWVYSKKSQTLSGLHSKRRELSTLNSKVRAVSLGGWLVIEKWIKPSLFDGIHNADLLDGTLIQLKAVTLGTYVAAEGGGGQGLVVNRESASYWESFKLWRLTSTTFQLRASSNQFVTIEKGSGTLSATKDVPGESETFLIIRNPSNPMQVHLKAANGKYVQAKGSNELVADYENEPGWNYNSAVFEMNVNTALGGEYQLTNGFGPSAAAEVLKEHRSTFVTAKDFQFLAANKINAVRIPVGWWIAHDPNPPAPFVGGSLNALDQAFLWARQSNIKVIIDLHAAPGSQSPWEHCGTRDGVSEWANANGPYIPQTLSVIEFLVARYASNPALLGIELLNEPGVDSAPLETLKNYYLEGYRVVRKYSSTAYVIMCQRIGASPVELVNVMKASNGFKNVALDVHFYMFESAFNNTSVQWNLDYIYHDRNTLLESLESADGPSIFVGEWTNEWTLQQAPRQDYQKFANAQLQVYGKASFGWSYWCLKNDKPRWDFEKAISDRVVQKLSNGGWP